MKSEMLVTVDADGQHDVRDITKIVTPIQEDKAEIVIGSRFLEKVENIPEYRKFGIKLILRSFFILLKSFFTLDEAFFSSIGLNIVIIPSLLG